MVFFLFLHACTPNVNEPEDDCVPKHGSVKPKRKCRSCLEGGSVHGWFFEVDHSARPHVFGERGAPFSGLGTHCSVISSDSQRRCARTALQDVMTTSCALTSMQGQHSCCAGIISLFFLVYVTVDSHSLVTWTVEVARRFLSAVVMSPEANWSPMKFSCVFHPLAVVCVRSYPALPEALRYQTRRRMCRASLPCFTCTPQNGHCLRVNLGVSTVDSHSLVTWTVEVAQRFLSTVVLSLEANWSPMQFSCVFHHLAVVCVRSYPALPEAFRYQTRRCMCYVVVPR